MKKSLLSLLILLWFTLPSAWAQIAPQALKDWKDQKYSMFIHWGGIYSVLGGVWDEKPVSRGLSEQIQAHAGIYSDTYAEVARQFDPRRWNPDSIALLAKAAGMRSIVITSKHHDGFCMWNTATTDFDVVDATPYQRDVLKDLSEACKRHGIRFGLYFSLIDWHYPAASPISSHNSDSITPAHHNYNKQQITELLTQYGPVSELWFDMGSQSLAQSREMRELVHRLQPNCMIGSRIGNDMGDFNVMGDNQEPDYVIGVPWQSPASFFDETWGYRSWQERGSREEKFREKLSSLIRVVSRGGKYLLNIGPRGDGSVVEFERDVLLDIGRWLNKNAEAVYGTTADPFHTTFSWGNVTSRPYKLYLFLLSPPENGSILLAGLSGKVRRVSVLGEKSPSFGVTNSPEGVRIKLPKNFHLEKEFKVLMLEFSGGYQVAPYHPIAVADTFELSPANAVKHYSHSGIDYNSRFQSTIKESWTVRGRQTETFQPVLYYSEEEQGTEIDLEMNGQTRVVKLEGGQAQNLNPVPVQWGPIYLNGPFWSGIDGLHGKGADIDPRQPWPNADGKPWTPKSDWKNGDTYQLPAGMNTAYYVLQEIASDTEQSVLVGITSGDGILVLFNGQELLMHNNPEKQSRRKDIVLLPLRKGKNQLVVKFYNNFQKRIPVAIDTQVSQTLYRLEMAPVTLQSGKHHAFSWQRHQPASPHQTIRLPNLSLQFIKTANGTEAGRNKGQAGK